MREWLNDPRAGFDALERGLAPDALAECAWALRHDWNGNPWDPPAPEQPGIYAWGEAHLQWAHVVQYEATGDSRYLARLMPRIHRLLALRDDRRGARDVIRNAVLPAWGSARFTEGRYTCCLVHAGMLLYPAARFVRLAAERPALRAAFAADVDGLTRAIGETLAVADRYWHDGPGPDEGYVVDDAIDPERPLPTNQQNALGRVWLELAVATGHSHGLQRAGRLARYFKNRLVPRNGAYDWAYWPPKAPPYDRSGSEDIFHAAINVDFAGLCARQNLVFSPADMQRFAATFRGLVGRADGRVADNVDGSGEGDLFARSIGWWGNLAACEPAVAPAIRAVTGSCQPPPTGPMALLTLAMLNRWPATPPAAL